MRVDWCVLGLGFVAGVCWMGAGAIFVDLFLFTWVVGCAMWEGLLQVASGTYSPFPLLLVCTNISIDENDMDAKPT